MNFSKLTTLIFLLYGSLLIASPEHYEIRNLQHYFELEEELRAKEIPLIIANIQFCQSNSEALYYYHHKEYQKAKETPDHRSIVWHGTNLASLYYFSNDSKNTLSLMDEILPFIDDEVRTTHLFSIFYHELGKKAKGENLNLIAISKSLEQNNLKVYFISTSMYAINYINKSNLKQFKEKTITDALTKNTLHQLEQQPKYIVFLATTYSGKKEELDYFTQQLNRNKNYTEDYIIAMVEIWKRVFKSNFDGPPYENNSLFTEFLLSKEYQHNSLNTNVNIADMLISLLFNEDSKDYRAIFNFNEKKYLTHLNLIVAELPNTYSLSILKGASEYQKKTKDYDGLSITLKKIEDLLAKINQEKTNDKKMAFDKIRTIEKLDQQLALTEQQSIFFKEKSRWLTITSFLIFILFLALVKHLRSVRKSNQEKSKLNKQLLNNQNLLEQKYLQVKRANQIMTDLSFSLSNDFKSPLRNIKIFVNELQSNPSNSEYKVLIDDTLENMNLVVDAYLKFACLDLNKNHFKKINIYDAYQTALFNLKNLIEDKNAKIEWKGSENQPFEFCYTNFITIFENIIKNALIFSKEDISPKIIVSVQKKEYEISISVLDNGIGIEKDKINKIFQPFYKLNSTKIQTPGLGLSAVEILVNHYNGKIKINSKPDIGTEFTINIPHSNRLESKNRPLTSTLKEPNTNVSLV